MEVSFMSGNQQAFVYKWTHIPSGKWYIGSRTAKNCHPNDGYLCSSDIVRPLIEREPDDWKREILCMGDSKTMRKKEAQFLKWFDAKRNPMSFNRSNSGGSIENAGGKLGMKKRFTISKTEKYLNQELAEDYKIHPDLTPRNLWNMGTDNLIKKFKKETDPHRKFLYNAFILECTMGSGENL